MVWLSNFAFGWAIGAAVIVVAVVLIRRNRCRIGLCGGVIHTDQTGTYWQCVECGKKSRPGE